MAEKVLFEPHNVFSLHEILVLKILDFGIEILKDTTRKESVLIHLRDQCNYINHEFTWFKPINSLILMGLKKNKRYHLRISVEILGNGHVYSMNMYKYEKGPRSTF